ncbi:MAG: tRNA (adenosine(37)-N6)-threonylcarbamoyltransferase complex dimerization subunit type 1 TsaB [Saprospiraceae bacterium]
MANLLIIESATDICSVAIVNDGKVLANRELLEPFKHSERLTILIQDALEAANLKTRDLDAIGLSSGPGSYTSLRVGASVAKGLCFGLDIPLIALDTLQGIAAGMVEANPSCDFYIPMIDARRMEVYCTVYDDKLNLIKETSSEVLTTLTFQEFENSKSLVIGGNGAEKTKELYEEKGYLYSKINRCNAIFFKREIVEKYNRKEFVDMALFEPSYLKSPAITRPKSLL